VTLLQYSAQHIFWAIAVRIMDNDQFPSWSSRPDTLAHLIAGLNASSTPLTSGNDAAWEQPGLEDRSNHKPRFISDPRDISMIRSPLPPLVNNTPVSRPLPQRRGRSTSQVRAAVSLGEQASSVSSFEPPLRSIFVSGPPTASVSANTALASLSPAAPSSGSGPLAALTHAGSSRRAHFRYADVTPPQSPVRGSSSRISLLNPEKEVDDPTKNVIPGSSEDASANTSAAFARLFASSNGPSPDPPFSRGLSHLRSSTGIGRPLRDPSTLTGHLLRHGLEEGRYSDVTVIAFGQKYHLHKLLLDRVPFFSSAFSGPWAESSSHEMTLLPEEIDSNISREAFELALKRIYGTHSPAQEDQETIGLFATACWLDMPRLVDSCVESILRQMRPSTLHRLIKLVTNNYYGKAGDRILSSAKAMLCREGWEMPYENWDDIPAEVVREVVGGDPFFVPGEWERWFLTLKLLNRRLRAKAVDAGLVSPSGRYLYPKPASLRFFAVRFDITSGRNSALSHHRDIAEKDEPWVALYASPEIAPLLVLLDEGIHYVHLRFEQLQQIRNQKDILGVPILPEKVIYDALWMSMELRQRILNAHETDVELGLSQIVHEEHDDADEALHPDQPGLSNKGNERVRRGRESTDDGHHDVEVGSWDGQDKPRKFWIPSHDVSCVMGGTREACLAANSTTTTDWTTHAARLSASLEPADVAWALDLTAHGLDHARPPARALSPTSPPRYSHYPPFRFSAEFPHPRTLTEKKRVYSQTVWYAGSMWNLYIQRVSTSKSQQLGIYLHRAKDKDPSDDPLAQFIPATVDDRIGQLEREMLLQKIGRRNRNWRPDALALGSEPDREDDSTTASVPEFDPSTATAVLGPGFVSPSTPRRPDGSARTHKISQNPGGGGGDVVRQPLTGPQLLGADEEDEELVRRANRKYSVSTMPPYMDARPTIKTYFKIYSPSRGGRLLSIYESAPDKFDVSKSWGWKSSQMVLDDGFGGYDVTKSASDSKLRYVVVLGNI